MEWKEKAQDEIDSKRRVGSWAMEILVSSHREGDNKGQSC
jgi:hypothetical protein